MKFKPVSTIAALLCGTLLLFAASMTALAQSGVRTAEFELNPPADAVDAFTPTGGGTFHFSFATGKTEWVPFKRPANIQELAELAMRERNPEKGPAGLDFSMMGEIDMRKVEIMILSESEIKSILSTGALPKKKPTTKPQGMKPDFYYLLKDESDRSFYVFKLKDHSPGYVWQEIVYVRIGEGESWKGNPGLAELLDVPKADAASNSRRKTNADKTRQRIQQAWDRKEAERKQAEKQAEQDALDKRIEDVKQQSAGDTFPKTEAEIKLVEDLIVSAKYDELLKLCEGKNLDFNVNATMGTSKAQVPLLSRAIERYPQYRDQYFLERKNKIFEFVLNHGGAAVIPTEMGASCVAEAAVTNNKTVFDLLVKNGFDFNQKIPNGKTVLEYLLEQNIKVDPEIMGKIQAATRPSLFTLVREGNADGLKKALEDEENRAAVNTPIEPTGGGVAGKTLLEYALSPKDGFPHTETVKTLLAAGAKFKERDISGLMLSKQEHLLPLFWEYRDRMSGDDWDKCFNYAALYRNTDAFKFFLEKGLDPEKPENSVSTRTPRFNAYLQGTPEMVEMMEARGYKKPFWAAIRWNDLDLVKEYLADGADVNEADNVSRSRPISLAMSTGNLELAELLLEHGVKVSPDDYRRAGDHYPVESVATNGQTKMVELLLKHGFEPDFPQTPGDTKHPRQSSALYIALLYKHYETAKVLLKYGARTDLTMKDKVWDSSAKKTVEKELSLEEIFKDDPEALKVLKGSSDDNNKSKEKGFFDFL